MNAIDEHDIRESFAALDDDKLGFLELDALYIMYLGLGYPYIEKEELARQILPKPFVHPQHVTVEEVLRFLANKTRDREEGMNAFFSAVDTGSKGFITPDDIVKLSKEIDGEAFSMEYAKTILEQSQSRNRTPGRLYQHDFEHLFTPKS